MEIWHGMRLLEPAIKAGLVFICKLADSLGGKGGKPDFAMGGAPAGEFE